MTNLVITFVKNHGETYHVSNYILLFYLDHYDVLFIYSIYLKSISHGNVT